MMYSISVIPKNTEVIGCGRHGCQCVYGFVTVAYTLRVRVERHTPDSLDLFIFFHEPSYQIHIWTVGKQWYWNHFHAEFLADSKMTVISGNRT